MEKYLAHHGVLGMKWGVRRYQNPDGTLTEEGKRRASSEANRIQKDIDKFKKSKLILRKNLYSNSISERKQDFISEFVRNNTDYNKLVEKISKDMSEGRLDPFYGSKTYDKTRKIASDILDRNANDNIKNFVASFIKSYAEDAALANLYDNKKYSQNSNDHTRSDSVEKSLNKVKNNSSAISKYVTNEIVSDLSKWNVDAQPTETFRKTIQEKIRKNIENANPDYGHYNDGIINFSIDGIKEYSDYQPLTIVYDLEKQKVKEMYYT